MQLKALAVSVFILAALAQSVAAGTKRIMNCEIDAKSIDECDTTAYLNRLIYLAAPGVAMAVILFLICPIFHLCHCCGCCGAGEVTKALSSCDVVRVKVYTIVCFILVGCSGALYGNISSGILTSGLLGLADDATAMPGFIQNELVNIENAMIVQRYSAVDDEFYTDNLFAGSGLAQSGNDTKKSLEDSINGVMNDFRDYVNQFAFILFLLFTIPVVIMLLGLLSAACNVRTCLPMIVAFFFFLFGFLLWLLYGIFGALSLVIGDVCAEVEGAATGQKTLLPVLTSCDNKQFAAFTDTFAKVERDTASSACEQIAKLCYQNELSAVDNLMKTQIYDCDVNGFPDCATVDFSDMVELLDGGIFTHQKIKDEPMAKDEGAVCRDETLQCSVSECGDNCIFNNNDTLSPSGRSSREMYYSFLAAQSVSTAFDTLGGRYGSCESLFGLLLGPFRNSCQDMVTGSLNTREAYGWTGLNAITAILCMIMGATKFMSFTEAAATRNPTDLDEEGHEQMEVKEQEPASTPNKELHTTPDDNNNHGDSTGAEPVKNA